jgi:hypothetical protein
MAMVDSHCCCCCGVTGVVAVVVVCGVVVVVVGRYCWLSLSLLTHDQSPDGLGSGLALARPWPDPTGPLNPEMVSWP